MKWYYIDGPRRVGPILEREWSELLRAGTITGETLVWHEGMEKWTPYAQIPREVVEEDEADEEEELPEDDLPAPSRSPEVTVHEFEAQILEQDYPVRIRETLGKAWRLFNRDLWLLVGATMFINVFIRIGGAIPVVNLLMQFAINGVLMAGLYSLYLRRIRGEPGIMLDVFSGFESGVFKEAVYKTLISTLIFTACFIPVSAAAIALGFYDVEKGEMLFNADPLAQSTLLLILLAGLIPVIYLGFCWIFALPLIIDRRLPFGVAMRLSRRKVLQHPWRISALITLAGLVTAIPGIITLLGVAVTGIAPANLTGLQQALTLSAFAVLFSMPIFIGSVLYLYETIFNTPPEVSQKDTADTTDTTDTP